MKICSYLIRLFHFPIPLLIIITLIALVCSTPAICGEIHNAAKAGDLAKVKTLLKENPELVSSKDDRGNAPLHMAVISGKKDMVELLLATGADVDAKNNSGDTPLNWAAETGNPDVVELLIAHNADVNAKNNYGGTILEVAVAYGHKKVIQLLRQHGAHE
jgi:ankyrin repeat protein